MLQPYQFYPAFKSCPSCRGRLLTAAPLTRKFTRGILQRLGITCYCVHCNSRYRAASWLGYPWISWLGPVGRWIWWRSAGLEKTLSAEAEEARG